MSALEGKVVLVTGASRGIGHAIAHVIGREGGRLIMVARQRTTLRRAAEQIPGGALAVPTDVTSAGQVERLFRIVKAEYGRLDVLVNNAGVFTLKPFVQTTMQDWRDNLDTNLTALFLTTRAALPLLKRSATPHLVNILSLSSRRAFPNCSAYTASKFGAWGLTQVLAEEFRPWRIRVTGIFPGATNTRVIRAFGSSVRKEELVQPGDVAGAVLAALLQPPRTTVEEVLLTPSRGAL